MYKHYNHEGGIAVPCILCWPAAFAENSERRGSIDDTPSHLIDILPTFLDAADMNPANADANRNNGIVGESLLPLIRENEPGQRSLFFEHEGNRAVRDGKWKLVALRDRPWELYNISEDRTEMNDLSVRFPDVVSHLSKEWDAWAADNHVTPLPRNYEVEYLPSR